jgi:predicted ATPase/DNA-binding SARP family transcriptional activator
MALEIAILGPVEARAHGQVVGVPAGKQRALLALLSVRSPHPVSAESAVDALWPRADPADAMRNLRVTVSRLRRSLGASGSALETVGSGYRLAVEPDAIDARRFETLVGEAQRARAEGDTAAARDALDDAFALWRGPPLADVAFESFAQGELRRLEELRLLACEERIEARLAHGEHALIVGELEQLVSEHPSRERLLGLLMIALHRCDRQTEALEVYTRGRRRLDEELGLEPSTTLRRLQEAILRHDPALDSTQPRRPLVAGHSRAPAGTTRRVLPTPSAPLIGRTHELNAVLALLEAPDVRLVTMTGPGGSGKTRLAIHAAAEIAAHDPDRVAWVPLDAVRDSSLVVDAVAQSVGAPGRRVEAHVGDAPLLLVMDNFEHVLDGASDLAALLMACGGLRVLATSREPLHLANEHEYPVSPLGRDEAVALLQARARAVGQNVMDDVETREICRRLDDLPLAIELAAARLRTLSPAQLLRRLDHRLPLLTGGARDAPARQRTLRATIEWSYELLDPGDRDVLGRLGVFVGGCALEAAEAVGETDIDAVQRLVEKGLVRRSGERLAMLETVREFSVGLLEAGKEEASVRRRHAEYFAAEARTAGLLARRSDRGAIELLQADHDNVRAAYDWALRAGQLQLCEAIVSGAWAFWVGQGMADEGFRRAQAVVARLAEPSEVLLAIAGELARFSGHLEQAMELKERALRLAERSGDRENLAASLADLAETVNALGLHDRAEALAQRAYAIRRELGDPWGMAHARSALVRVALRRGADASAAAMAEESMPVYRADDSWVDLGWECILAAAAHRRIGDTSRAKELVIEALDCGRRIDDQSTLTGALEQAAALHAVAGEHEEALRFYGAALRWRNTTRDMFDADDDATTLATDSLSELARDSLITQGTELSLNEAADRARLSLQSEAGPT